MSEYRMCQGTTKSGRQCKNQIRLVEDFCVLHRTKPEDTHWDKPANEMGCEGELDWVREKFNCPECGEGVVVDNKGWCTTCGNYRTRPAATEGRGEDYEAVGDCPVCGTKLEWRGRNPSSLLCPNDCPPAVEQAPDDALTDEDMRLAYLQGKHDAHTERERLREALEKIMDAEDAIDTRGSDRSYFIGVVNLMKSITREALTGTQEEDRWTFQ